MPIYFNLLIEIVGFRVLFNVFAYLILIIFALNVFEGALKAIIAAVR